MHGIISQISQIEPSQLFFFSSSLLYMCFWVGADAIDGKKKHTVESAERR